jgi:hypothetical protein
LVTEEEKKKEIDEDAGLAHVRVRSADPLARASVSLPRERTPELSHRLGYRYSFFSLLTPFLSLFLDLFTDDRQGLRRSLGLLYYGLPTVDADDCDMASCFSHDRYHHLSAGQRLTYSSTTMIVRITCFFFFFDIKADVALPRTSSPSPSIRRVAV